MTLAERYELFCATPSSINELLPILRQYASECDAVAEFGVDIGQSTTAFLMAQPKLVVSIDPVYQPALDELWNLGAQQVVMEHSKSCIIGNTAWYFEYGDHLNTPVHALPYVDLLLLDSIHYYEHIKAELDSAHANVKKWIMAHDTLSYGEVGEIPGSVGILPAIYDFLFEHPEWAIREHIERNNGLMILERAPL